MGVWLALRDKNWRENIKQNKAVYKSMSVCNTSESWSISAGWVFRGTEYAVCADVRDDVLFVQVEDKLTADRWRGQFDAKHIEELTRKTGNFKQFSIFLNMLESAITKSSDSVALDLLTFADLEALRKTKFGSGSGGGRGLTPGKAKAAHAKRYLILTYSVEFDRIHYPLALPYCGPPDPALLQATIKKLLSELEKTKKHGHGHNQYALARLQKEYDALLREKEELEEEFETFKQDMMLTQQGAATKEIKILKKVIKNLEEELLKERSKYQKYTTKRNEEFKALIRELEELRSSERALHCRVKSLTNELAVMKRNARSSPYRTPVSGTGSRAGSGQRSTAPRGRQRSVSSDRGRIGVQRRSFSNERRVGRPNLRTPSPASGSIPRFDPTAYVERKKQRQQEINSKLRRSKLPRSRTNSTETLLRPPKPPTSAGRGKTTFKLSSSRGSSRASSRRSSVELASDEETWYDRSSSLKSGGKKTRQVWGSSPQMSTATPTDRGRTASKQNDSGLVDHSAEISEIDARLHALQEFMKRSMETNKSKR